MLWRGGWVSGLGDTTPGGLIRPSAIEPRARRMVRIERGNLSQFKKSKSQHEQVQENPLIPPGARTRGLLRSSRSRSSLRYAQRPAPLLPRKSPLVRNPHSTGGLMPPPSFTTLTSTLSLSIAYFKLPLVRQQGPPHSAEFNFSIQTTTDFYNNLLDEMGIPRIQ